MEFGESRTFRLPTGNSFSESQLRTSDLLSGLRISKNLLSSSSLGQKRKRQSEKVVTSQAKRSRSNSSRRQIDIISLVTAEEDDATAKANKYSVEQPNATSLIGLKTPKDELFDNRIFFCLVISPPGRPINKFQSVREFLEACRNFIKAHRSLYYDGKILYRDISKNNIIVTDTEGEGDPKEMLINLDLAKKLDSGPSGARHRTGTIKFMAIEVLEGRAYTYRYDLKSFFYIFLWVIIRYGQEMDKNLPKTSRLRR
jgi:Fungal protein kinase